MCSIDCETPRECLDGALQALAVEDLTSSFGPAVIARTGALVVARTRLDAEVARTVREGELTQAAEHDGKATMASWLRGHHRLSKGESGRLVRNGRVLEKLPTLAAAAKAGAVSAEAVSVLAPVVSEVNLARADAQGIDVNAIDALLTEVAVTSSHDDLRQAVGHYLARLDPDGSEPDPTEQRSLTFTKHTDGTVTIHGTLDAVGGEKVQTAVESIQQACRPAGDTRSRAQQAGDALVQLADNALASGSLPMLRGHKPHVGVLIDLDDLMDTSSGAGAGAGRTTLGGIISAAKARWLACDGNVTRIVIGPEGQPLDVGQTKRLFPPHLRRAIEVRDKHCVFAGCDAPSYWCDVHHVIHWIDGGDTCLDNGALLCERHHTKVHHGFRISRLPDGRWRTFRPDGTEILIGEPFLVGA